MKNGTFLFPVKSILSFSRNLNFCPDLFGYVEKRINKKAKVNLNIYGLTDWEINNYNTRIIQYLKK